MSLKNITQVYLKDVPAWSERGRLIKQTINFKLQKGIF